MVRILSIPYKATVELQRRDLTLSDAYASWLKMELHLESKKKRATLTKFETYLIQALEKKKVEYNLFTNSLTKAALFLDPRFHRNIVRNERDMIEVKNILLTLSRRLILLSEEEANENTNNSIQSTNSSDSSFDVQEAFDNLNNTVTPNIHSDFEAIIDAFSPTSMKLDAFVLKYWCDRKDSQMLYDVAMTIFAIPPTEVDIERNFSALKNILTDLRSSLAPKTLEDILSIFLNREIYLDVNNKVVIDLEKEFPPLKYI